MPSPKSAIERAADVVIDHLEDMCSIRCADVVIDHLEAMCSIRCPPEHYKAALERILEHIEASIDAVKDDIRRQKGED